MRNFVLALVVFALFGYVTFNAPLSDGWRVLSLCAFGLAGGTLLRASMVWADNAMAWKERNRLTEDERGELFLRSRIWRFREHGCSACILTD